MPTKKIFYRLFLAITYLNLGLCLILWGPASHAKIYKWVDENGQVHYGSQPQLNNQSVETIKIRKNTTTTPRISKEDLAIDAMNKKEADAERARQEALRSPPVEQKIPASEKRRLCQQAKSDYADIMSRGRMRERQGTTGEYVYLTEAQRQQRLSAAQKKQREYCR